jgi:membrane protease YdiL (CAAX protease family)
MSGKKSLHLFWGVVFILIGGLLGLIVAQAIFNLVRKLGGPSDPWLIGGLVLLGALCAFCVWMSTREFQRATGQEVRKLTLRWARMLAGICMVFISLKSHIAPSPNALKADNPGEAAGMLMATVFMVLIGLWLAASSFKPRKPKPQLNPTLENSSAQGENMRLS